MGYSEAQGRGTYPLLEVQGRLFGGGEGRIRVNQMKQGGR